MKTINNLSDVYVSQLQDLYSAETQLVKALPKLAKAASLPELAAGFSEHLEQTKEHVRRLEEILEALEVNPGGKKCKAMEGLIAEGAESIDEVASPEAKDALLIAAAQRVEHYEIAAYGTVKAFAKILGEDDALELIEETLAEEVQTNEKLTKVSRTVNESANNENSDYLSDAETR